MNPASPLASDIETDSQETEIERLLSVDILRASQQIMTMSDTTKIPSQIPANNNHIDSSVDHLTERQLARRRQRQRRCQRRRDDEQLRRQDRQLMIELRRQQQHQTQLQENDRCRQERYYPQLQENRNREDTPLTFRRHAREQPQQQRPSSTRTTYYTDYRSRRQRERDFYEEREYYLSLGFTDDLDDIDPADLLEQLEIESMDPREATTQRQLHEYERLLPYEVELLRDATGASDDDVDATQLLQQLEKENIDRREAALQCELREYEKSLRAEEISSIESIVQNSQYHRNEQIFF